MDGPVADQEKLRQKRERSLRYLGVSLLAIAVGFLSMLTVAAWQIIAIVLWAPTFFGGYHAGVYVRNWFKGRAMAAGEDEEIAERNSLALGAGSGLVSALALGALEMVLLLLLRASGTIS